MTRPTLHLPFPHQPRPKLKGGSTAIRSKARVPGFNNPHYEVTNQMEPTPEHLVRPQKTRAGHLPHLSPSK